MNSVINLQFKSRIFVTGTITAETGLHIGGSSVEMGIGGADSIVIRDPITNYPYIPGSSLRGKMRSLLEKARKEMTFQLKDDKQPITSFEALEKNLSNGRTLKSAGPATDPGHIATNLFGVAVDKQEEFSIPQRLVVRDAMLVNPEELEAAKNTDMPMTEVKTEVAIDRITSKANPRQIERVPAGARFSFEFILNLYGEDKQEDYLGYLFECMQLLQDDYLGGHGSRGYGRVSFLIENITEKSAEDYKDNKPAKKVEGVDIPEALCNDKEL
ncbi:MAG: type III-A CRISPR-associated RAMP protein Csm3 [Deltaproteobacteria bacterium]|nr:MAG: type III-A CRISPR-associated RAMP protein Csm3 [Deltaproteobacteria bacterium]